MSIVNLQRDAVFIVADKDPTSWSASNAYGNTVLANTDPVIYDDFATCLADRTAPVDPQSGEAQVIGCFIQPPASSITPYRVKAWGKHPEGQLQIIVGWGPEAPTGTNDQIDSFQSFVLEGRVDELVLVTPRVVKTFPIFVGCAVTRSQGPELQDVTISVQRLATSPPQFAQSCS